MTGRTGRDVGGRHVEHLASLWCVPGCGVGDSWCPGWRQGRKESKLTSWRKGDDSEQKLALMVPSKTSFVITSALGHTRLWLQSVLHRGCSRTQVFSISLHFCFVSAHPSFLPGDGLPPHQAQKEALKGRVETSSPKCLPSTPRRHGAQKFLCLKEVLNKSD